jgi:dUTP pyrophosphatase
MNVPIILLDSTVEAPKYHSEGACAFDIAPKCDCTIEPSEITLLPTGYIIKVPEGHMLMIAPRSSLPRKKLLVFPHSIGIIDQDYCGPEDELQIQVQNISTEVVNVQKGERIAQGVFVCISKAEWQITDTHNAATRGGFGSTGL